MFTKLGFRKSQDFLQTLITQRWISTGASLHGDSITSNEMILDVFGGDTYINMFFFLFLISSFDVHSAQWSGVHSGVE